MAVASQWNDVLIGLERLGQYSVLHSTVVAMRRLVGILRTESALEDVAVVLSHASLVLARGDAARRVLVGWQDGDFNVCFVGPGFELSPGQCVGASDVVRVLREHLERCVDDGGAGETS